MVCTRRQFLRTTSAGILTGVATVPTAGQSQSGSVPAYADWVPDDNWFVGEDDVLGITSFDVRTFLELVDADGEDTPEDPPPTFWVTEKIGSAANYDWSELADGGLAKPVLGQSAETAFDDPITGDIPVDRHTILNGGAVYTGSFDTDALTAAAETLEETKREGIYTYEATVDRFVSFGPEFVVVADSIDAVEAVLEAGRGTETRRYETDGDFATLLSAGGHGEFATATVSTDGLLEFESDEIETALFEDANGFAQSNWIDTETWTLDSTTVVQYPEAASSRIETTDELVFADKLRDRATRYETASDGRRFTVEVTYNPGQDSDSRTNRSDGNGGSADDGGPGFGPVGALTGLGVAGYLLAQLEK